MTTPFAVARLNRHPSENDTATNINSNEISEMSKYCDKYTVNGKRAISKIPLSIFFQCHINHFHIMFLKNEYI